MDKLQFSKFCASLVLVISMSAEAEFSYEKNTFINYNNCLGIYPGTSLRLDEKAWFISMDQSPMIGKIAHVIRAAEAEKRLSALGFKKINDDKRLWAEIGCAHSFRGDMPESLARISPESEDSSNLGFAIRGLPASAWISEGAGDSISMGIKDNPYVGLVRHHVTNACYAPDSLIRIKKFPVQKGRAIIQLDIGKVKKAGPEKRKQRLEEEMRQVEEGYVEWAWPEYKKKTMEEWTKKEFVESVEICRFFLDGKRVLRQEKISRNTGVEERVDTATDLNTDNWADTTDNVIGFISLNEGKDWDALLVDIGWEGINYSIQRLNDSTIQYDRSLYTYH